MGEHSPPPTGAALSDFRSYRMRNSGRKLMPSAGRRVSLCRMTKAVSARISAHPTIAFFVLAFAMSWTLMTPAMIAGLDSVAALPFFVGVFAPATAAAIVTRVTGGSVGAWLRDILGWRLPLRWYALAAGFPLALAVVASAEFAVVGEGARLRPRGRAGGLVAAPVRVLPADQWRPGGASLAGLGCRASGARSRVKAILVFGPISGMWDCRCPRRERRRPRLATMLIGMLSELAGSRVRIHLHVPVEPHAERISVHDPARVVQHGDRGRNPAAGGRARRQQLRRDQLALTGPRVARGARAGTVATRGRLGLPAATASVSGPRPGGREARTVPAPGQPVPTA